MPSEDGLKEIPVDGEIGIRSNALVGLHGDPAGRIIVATALEGHEFITSNGRMLGRPGSLRRPDAKR